MFAGQETAEGGSNAWQSAGEVRSGGWPLGLQQAPMTRGFPEAPAAFFIISTPSITSESSSDLDTASTGSFFPERSQTLGSLIGIQSNGPQNEQSKALVEAHLMTEMAERRRSVSGLRLGRTSWCPMLGCRGGSNPESLGMSPSLAHLLEEERKATGSQRQSSSNTSNEAGGPNSSNDSSSLLLQRNTLFDEEGILPPHPSGAPLKLILQHSSPNSSYLSADWNVFNARHPHHHTQQGGAGGGAGPTSHGRFPTFWPGLCGRLSPGLAG